MNHLSGENILGIEGEGKQREFGAGGHILQEWLMEALQIRKLGPSEVKDSRMGGYKSKHSRESVTSWVALIMFYGSSKSLTPSNAVCNKYRGSTSDKEPKWNG